MTLNNPVIQNFYGSRTFKMFSNIISGQIDLSIRERFNEIESTYKTMVDISPTTFVVGLGHGAVWNAKNYPGDLRSLSRNLTKEGYIHNIHIGPVLLIFRYGLFGLLMFFCLIYTVGKSIIYIKNNIKIIINDQQREAIMILFFTTNVLIVALLNFLTKNILIDPLFGFSLGLNILIFKKLKYFRIKNLGLV